jgi:hypothetical protein
VSEENGSEKVTVGPAVTVGALPLRMLQKGLVNYGDTVSEQTVSRLERFVNDEWLPATLKRKPEYSWWGMSQGVPSPIIRIDGAPFAHDWNVVSANIYEVEKRPGGCGVISAMFPEHVGRLCQAMRPCSALLNLGGPESIRNDDEYFARVIGKPFLSGDSMLMQHLYDVLMVRHDTLARWHSHDDTMLSQLEQKSCVPIREDGCKWDLVDLGIAFHLDWYLEKHDGVLPWENGFCIKPLRGTWAANVYVHTPSDGYKKWSHTKLKILGFIEKNGSKGLLIQSFIPPRRQLVYIGEKERVCCEIQRMYFAFDHERRVYGYVGGLTIGTPSLRVHGTPDAYARKIVIE